MSMSALLTAVRDRLRATIPLPPEVCDIQEDAQPIAQIGQLYVAVHPLGIDPTEAPDAMMALDEFFGVGVTITRRIRSVPDDRLARQVYLDTITNQSTGMERLAYLIRVRIHKRQEVIDAANQLITGSQQFMEVLRWSGMDPWPKKVDGTWFFAKPEAASGLTQTVMFSGGRRAQDFPTLDAETTPYTLPTY